MAVIGNYADHPLPEEWLPVLEGLRPAPILPLHAEEAPSPANLIDLALEHLDERSRDVLIWRYLDGFTLEEVGGKLDVTRERIRQIEVKALKKIRITPFSRLFRHWIASAEKLGIVISNLPLQEEKSFFVPKLDVESLWKLAISLFRMSEKSSTETMRTEKLPNGNWVLFVDELHRGTLRQTLTREPRFISFDAAVEKLQMDAYLLAHIYPFFEDVYLTMGSSFGCKKWTVVDWIEAVAWILADHGFTDFHFSEIRKAINLINPTETSNSDNRNFAAAVSRSDHDRFEYAGQKGRWRLRAVGDGFANNKDAVIAILERSELPMHVTQIHNKLNRPVREGTVAALLNRDEDFESFGEAYYGLKHKRYPANTVETIWLKELMADRVSVNIHEVEQTATLHNISIDRLRSSLSVSSEFCFTRTPISHQSSYQTRSESFSKRFERWFYYRETTSIPDIKVLVEGTRRAFEHGDYLKVLRIRDHLLKHSVKLNDDLDDYFMIALSRSKRL